MFCPNCGKEIPDETKFCTHCGAEQTAYNVQPTPAPQEPVQNNTQQTAQPVATTPVTATPQKPKNKKLVPIIIGIAAFVVASGVIAPAISNSYTQDDEYDSYEDYDDSDDYEDGTDDFVIEDSDDYVTDNTDSSNYTQPETDNTYNSSENSTSTSNSSYDEIFTSRNIITAPSAFFGLESAVFATVDSNGIVVNEEFGYDGDLVKEWVTTFYIPTAVYSEMDLSKFNQVDALDFCTVTNSSTVNYKIVSMDFTNLDNTQNVQKLAEFEMITNNQNAISMKQTEKDRLASGYVKK